MKKLIIVSILASLAWAQDLTLKKNNQTATITYNQPIEIISKDNDVLKGRFLKIENNSIVLEGSIIPINQVREIKLPYLRLKSTSKGFVKGGLTCVGLTLGGMVVIAGVSSAELDGGAMLFAMVTTPFAALIGGGVSAIRHYNKAESSYKIDQDNWRIVSDIVSPTRKKR